MTTRYRRKAMATSALMAASLMAPISPSLAQSSGTCLQGIDIASLGPKTIVGQGPNGEQAASADTLQISNAEVAKIKAGHFKVGITMQTVNLDWSQLQIQGVTDTLNKYGVEVTGVASAEYQVDKQIADIENTIQRHPDGIISIPVDGTATAATYRKVSQAGIKLVFMDNVPPDMKHPEQYAAMVSADSQGNAYIAAAVLASCIPQGGTVGLINFGVDYFSTNQRTKGVKDWLAKNRRDIKIKQTDFTDPAKVAQIAGDFLTANPDVKGLFGINRRSTLFRPCAPRASTSQSPRSTLVYSPPSKSPKAARSKQPDRSALTTRASPKPKP
jgi:ribose transport system substrate-binding protein